MAVFDLAQNVVASAGGVIAGNTAIDAASTMQEIVDKLDTMEIGELFMLSAEILILSLAVKLMSVAITVILYGRMIEIYLYTSVAPIPFATMTNREWGNIGNNYIKGLFALGFQGFFMMVCVGIYSALIANMSVSGDVHTSLFSIAAYTVVLAFTLFKTGSISKSIFNAH